MALVKFILAFKHYLLRKYFPCLATEKHFKKNHNLPWLYQINKYTFTFHHITKKYNDLANNFSGLQEEHPQQNLPTNPGLINSDDKIQAIVENKDQIIL